MGLKKKQACKLFSQYIYNYVCSGNLALVPKMALKSTYKQVTKLTKRDELSFLIVFAFPNTSRTGWPGSPAPQDYHAPVHDMT